MGAIRDVAFGKHDMYVSHLVTRYVGVVYQPRHMGVILPNKKCKLCMEVCLCAQNEENEIDLFRETNTSMLKENSK